MKKKDLERVRAQSLNTRTDTDALRQRVATDLNVIKDAYDTGSIALIELTKQFANIPFSDKPVKELSELARAYGDITKALIALRGEGRTTIREAVASAGPQAETVIPPSPVEGDGGGVYTDPTKIFPSRASPLALGEFLKASTSQGVIYEGIRESIEVEGFSGHREGPPGTPWVLVSPEGECREGDPED